MRNLDQLRAEDLLRDYRAINPADAPERFKIVAAERVETTFGERIVFCCIALDNSDNFALMLSPNRQRESLYNCLTTWGVESVGPVTIVKRGRTWTFEDV